MTLEYNPSLKHLSQEKGGMNKKVLVAAAITHLKQKMSDSHQFNLEHREGRIRMEGAFHSIRNNGFYRVFFAGLILGG